MRVQITQEVLDPRSLEQELVSPANGAVVTFQGVVRNNAQGRTVAFLEYDAYVPMAEKVLAQIVGEVAERWQIQEMGVWHRTGRLEIGETSLLVVVCSPHRAEAFDAIRYAVDRIKAIVPIWKKETAEDGESWVEGDLLIPTGEHTHTP